MGRLVRGAAACAVVTLALGGCRPDDQRTDTIDPETSGRAELSPETLAQIDSGNAAYRRGEYEAAATSFRAATASAPDNPTGWFGVYMAEQALGDTAAADSALATARSLAPGASLIRPPSGGDGGGSEGGDAGGGSP